MKSVPVPCLKGNMFPLVYLEQSLELDPEQEKVKFLIEQIRESHPR